MRLLWLTPYLPSPQTFGGQRRVHGLMHALAARHDIAVLSLHSPTDPQDEWTAATRAWCPDTEVFVQPASGLEGSAKRTAQLRTLASTSSWESSSHRNDALAARATERLRTEHFDAVIVEFAQMAVNLRRIDARVPVVLDEHNVEFDLQRRTVAQSDSLVRRVFGAANWRKLRREEVALWRSVSGVAATSDRDLQLVRQDARTTPAVLAPNGVSLEDFQPGTDAPDPTTVVFFGAHNYFPNADGLRFLFGEIWPLVTAQMPSARLRVIGHPPTDDIAALAPAGVSVEGYVDDLPAEVLRSSVAIAPLRIGGGTRLKIIEAMALARAVVATPIGAEGLDVESGRDLVVAGDPQAFADAVVRLLQAPAEAAELGRRARRRVEESYGWSACAAPLEQLVTDLVARRR